ncbi:MAG: germination protein YpeB [Clostridia bacterium]|nr:germination protein YpeB [Clostridia bacterium]
MSQKTKRIIERAIVPSVLTIALISVCFWGISESTQAENYKQTTESVYRRVFTELCDDFSNMEVALSKLRAASTPSRYILLLDDIWRLSGSAVSLMSQVPSSHVDTNELNSFVVRVGDYSHALTKKLLKGEALSEDDTKQIKALQEKCAEISEELNVRLADGNFPITALDSEGFFTSSQQDGDNYKDTEGINEFPTLIYDGPFSESTEKAQAKGVTGDNVSEEEALEIARSVLEVSGEPSQQGFSNGTIPSYDFTFEDEKGNYADISITRQGGMLLWAMKSSADGAAQTETASNEPTHNTNSSSAQKNSTSSPTDNTEQGNKDNTSEPNKNETQKLNDAALKKLIKLGFENMQPTYAQYYNGVVVINFAATQDDVILYNDLVKVWIERSSLEVVGIDARNYLFSHTQRELKEPQITLEEAREKLSKELNVQDSNIALIPLTPQTEVLCYEFKATIDNDEYIVYVNVETGEEEEIYKIINTETGQLVI